MNRAAGSFEPAAPFSFTHGRFRLRVDLLLHHQLVLDLADELLPSLITNMSNTEILRLLIKCYPLIGSTELEQYRLPPDGGYERAVIRGLFVLVPDLDKCREALNTYLPLE